MGHRFAVDVVKKLPCLLTRLVDDVAVNKIKSEVVLCLGLYFQQSLENRSKC